MAETTVATTPVAEPSKSDIRRANEKALRAAIKPDYRSAGVTLKVLKANPKKVGSNAHAVFAKYTEGMLVSALLASADAGEIKNAKGEVVSKSYVGACLMWDERHGFITLVAPAKPAAAEPVAAPAAS